MYGSGYDDYAAAGYDDYGVSGYDEIIGGLDELDALDAAAGDSVSVGDGELEGIAGYHRRRHHGIAGYDEIIGDLGDADVGADDIASLMAAAGAAMPHRPIPRRPFMPPIRRALHHVHPHRRPPAVHHHHHPHPVHHEPCPVCAAQAHHHHHSRVSELADRLHQARQVDPHAVAVVQRPQDRRREFPVGLVSPGPTAFGTSAQATAFPQVTFRPERLVIPSQIAPFFTIDAIIVGKDNQSVSFDPIPATMFSEVGVGVRLNLKTAVVGMQIIVRFTNVDPLQQTRAFSGGIIGTAVE
jgi:hypothetical protein